MTRFFGSVAAITRQAVPAVAKGSGLPLTLLVPILLFVVVQHLIDRRDPKLALAPTYPEPTLPFDPDPASPPR